ncbi:MAG: glycosyltransferase [Candidatus ainarchaeum sp.]|nr:glycosyltransferase [Candidatus ainarchaeum sp.]
MKALIFSEGNGYGHAARDSIIARHFGFPIMTFGKGAEYCRLNAMHFIETPPPYVIRAGKEKVQIASEITDLIRFLKPASLAKIQAHFMKVDLVIVDGSPLGLAIAGLAGKKAVYISNDTSALVGVHGHLQKKVAGSLLDRLMLSARIIIVPDFPPPLTVTALNLDSSFPLAFIGPLVERRKQISHNKRFVVAGLLEKELKPYLGGQAIYGGKTDIRSCYADAELVICHGGHTTIMEALSYGKPVLCIVDKTYSERYNNALMLEKKGIGVLLDKDFLTAESLQAAIDYAKTLNHKRLALYRDTAEKLDPMAILAKAMDGI